MAARSQPQLQKWAWLTVNRASVTLDGTPCLVTVTTALNDISQPPARGVSELFCKLPLLREALSWSTVVLAPKGGTGTQYELVGGVSEYQLLLAVGQQHEVTIRALILAQPVHDATSFRLWETWARLLLTWSLLQSLKTKSVTQDAAPRP